MYSLTFASPFGVGLRLGQAQDSGLNDLFSSEAVQAARPDAC